MPAIPAIGITPPGGSGFGGGGGWGGDNTGRGWECDGSANGPVPTGYSEYVEGGSDSPASCNFSIDDRRGHAIRLVREQMPTIGASIGNLFVTWLSDGTTEAWEFRCSGIACASGTSMFSGSPKYTGCN